MFLLPPILSVLLNECQINIDIPYDDCPVCRESASFAPSLWTKFEDC